jgi:hypothetical protein
LLVEDCGACLELERRIVVPDGGELIMERASSDHVDAN